MATISEIRARNARWEAEVRRARAYMLRVRVASRLRRYLAEINYLGLRLADKRTWNELQSCADELADDRLSGRMVRPTLPHGKKR